MSVRKNSTIHWLRINYILQTNLTLTKQITMPQKFIFVLNEYAYFDNSVQSSVQKFGNEFGNTVIEIRVYLK